jgi:hypothetical protein
MDIKVNLLESEQKAFTPPFPTKNIVAFFRYWTGKVGEFKDPFMDELLNSRAADMGNMFGLNFAHNIDKILYLSEFYRLNSEKIHSNDWNVSSYVTPKPSNFEVIGVEDSKVFTTEYYKSIIMGYNDDDIKHAYDIGELEVWNGELIDKEEYDSETMSTYIDSISMVKEEVNRIKTLLNL